MSPDEVPLTGGDVTEGVVRVGNTVRRPPGPHSPLVQTVLTYLADVGFGGAPRWLGTDENGRDVLTFVPGEVAGRPGPPWLADEARATSVARLVRSYDDAVAPLGVPALAWELAQDEALPEAPPSVAGAPTMLGHLDITPENVVFRDVRAAALIDFDCLRPATIVEEVCNLLLWWAPLMPVGDRQPVLRDVDPIARARLIVNAYRLAHQDRARVVEVAQNTADRAWFFMRSRAERLGGGWARMWAQGAGERIVRRQRWLEEQSDALHDAVLEGPVGPDLVVPGGLIYHLARRDDWQDAIANQSTYRCSTLGQTLSDVGFIHCSFASQVAKVADLAYRGHADVLLLTIDVSRVGSPVKVENLDGGKEVFPHIYGPLPLRAVVDVTEVHLKADGSLDVAPPVVPDQ